MSPSQTFPVPGSVPAARFAPSPTGPLHLGHAYAALVAHGAARAMGGRFLVRIEDLDTNRSHTDYERAIFEDLVWLGLTADETPVRQSERGPAYRAAIERLLAAGLLYPCFCTRAEIAAEVAAIGAAPHGEAGEGFGPFYPGTCRRLSTEDRVRRLAAGAAHALRLDMAKAIAHAEAAGVWPAQFSEVWAMGVPTSLAAAPEPAGDIVLTRKDMAASYHLAVVVDDAAAGITLVTRGEDLLPSTHIHVLLQKLLDLPTPLYGHHALVRDAAGKRLATRDKAHALSALRAQGWSAQEIRATLPPLPDFSAIAAAAGL